VSQLELVRPFRRGSQLNQVERWKQARHPLDVADAVVNVYAREGPEAIETVEGEEERLKWVGLYPQRQGGDAFMMRIKVPGGRLLADQAARIGEIAETFARGPVSNPVWGDGFCDLTTRQDVQLHWIRIGDVPEIWRQLEEVGITTVQACGDSARNVLCCPLSGVDGAEVVESYPVAAAISSFFTGNREYANLPRKFKISVTGCTEDCVQAELNDIGLCPARQDDGTPGFNVLIGGGLGDGPRMASDIDVFVEPDQAIELCRAVAQVFGELGNRENRGLARMRYLAQELGPEGFRDELGKRAAFRLRPAGEGLTRAARGDHVGVHRQREEGRFYVGCNVVVGRMAGRDLVEAARVARTYGDGTIRLGTKQDFILTGVPEDRLEELLALPLFGRYQPFPGPFARGAVACTGSEFCRFAVVETKARAAQLAWELDRRVGKEMGDEVVRIHFSGCPASCAQPQIADIGLRGETAHVGDSIVEAADIGLGGSLGPDAAFIDWVDGARPADQLVDGLTGLVRRFRSEQSDGEAFHQWARRIPGPSLRDTLETAVRQEGGTGRGRRVRPAGPANPPKGRPR
jgi:ferredoxin-nitrite reductase